MALPETGSDWIEHSGDGVPVVYGMLVDVKHRDGRVWHNQPAGVAGLPPIGFAHDWRRIGAASDIIAYRIAQPDAAPAANAEANILREAEDIIYGDREATYGHPAKNLESIARFWTGYLKQKYGIEAPLTPEDVCWMMALLKMSRQMNSHKRDNLVDAAGYLALIERVQGAAE